MSELKIRNFKECTDSLKLYGGKGMSLVKLSRFFNVPNGYLVSTNYFSKFLTNPKRAYVLSELKRLITSANKFDYNNVKLIESIGKNIRQKLLEDTSEFDTLLQTHFSPLNLDFNASYSIRSSATTEDLTEFAFAGQHDTFLHITSLPDVIDKIKLCYISLFSNRAIQYRSRNGFMDGMLDGSGGNVIPLMSVVVQEMVDSVVAGVVFTVDVLNDSRKVVTVNCSYGLGEAVVAGMVNSDVFKYDKNSGKIIMKEINEKNVMIKYADVGTIEKKVESSEAKKQCLDDESVIKLSKIAMEIEKRYDNKPMDIEFAVDDKKEIFILQARSITTVYPNLCPMEYLFKENVENFDEKEYYEYCSEFMNEYNKEYHRIYHSVNHAQMYLKPFSPLGMASLAELNTDMYKKYYDGPAQYCRNFQSGNRFYLAMGDLIGGRLMKAKRTRTDARAIKALDYVLSDEEFKKNHTPKLKGGTKLFVRDMLKKYGCRILCGFCKDAKSHKQSFDEAVANFVQNLPKIMEYKFDEVKSENENIILHLNKVRSQLRNFIMGEMFEHFLEVSYGIGAVPFLKKITREQDIEVKLLGGIDTNVVTLSSLKLAEIGDKVRDKSDVIEALHKIKKENINDLEKIYSLIGDEEIVNDLKSFFSLFGCRCEGEVDIMNERYSNNPIMIVNVLLSSLNTEKGIFLKNFEKSRDESIKEMKNLYKKMKCKNFFHPCNLLTCCCYSICCNSIIWKCMTNMRTLIGYREHPKYLLVLFFDELRKQVLFFGDYLVKIGFLYCKEDVFYLTYSEIEQILQKKDTIKQEYVKKFVEFKKAEFIKAMKLDVSPPMMNRYQEDVEKTLMLKEESSMELSENEVKGTGVSRGIIKGKVRVCMNFEDTKFIQKGEILITKGTDPGWTLVFVLLSGLVLEVGSALTHGAITARELGIPASVGIKGATQIFKTGDEIELNGTTGIIKLIKRAEEVDK